MSLKKESLSDVRLHAAARRGDLVVIRHLLDSGRVYPDCRDKDGTTPLMITAAAGHLECCLELLRQGANPSQRRKTGAGALFLAAQEGFCDVVRLLIRAGAHINTQCKDGGTPLMVAAQEGHVDVCLELIESGADVHHQMKDGATSLFLAAQNGHAKVVALILAAAAAASARQGTVGGGVTEAANVRRTDGATPLWMAAQMGFDNVIRLLMKAGANPEISRNDGVSPLLKACQKDHVDAVRELLQWNPHLGLAQNGDSPLYAAVLRRNSVIIHLLMEAGADPNLVSTRSGLSPLSLATEMRLQPKVLKLLNNMVSIGDGTPPTPEQSIVAYVTTKRPLLVFSC